MIIPTGRSSTPRSATENRACDGSVACIPAWMTRELAAHYQVRSEPRLSLDALRCLRAEIDALLGFLQSDSGMENANNEAGPLAERVAGDVGRSAAELPGTIGRRSPLRRSW